MRNIFLFIRRYFNLFFFLLLQGFSVYLIGRYSRYHQSMFSGITNQVTGKINEQYDKVEYYFQLKKTNDSLVAANARLYNKLKADFELPDTTSKTIIDSLKVDSLESYRKYTYLPAKVVANSVNTQNNFIVINRGEAQGLKNGMGVADPNNSVVGIIIEISKNYSVVMSLLHKDSRISGKLFKSGEVGTVSWDGKVPNILSFTGITKSTKVAKGDTIISSGFSTSLPKGLMIGYIEEIIPEKSSNNFMIKLKSAANFYNLEYTNIIDNSQQEEINKLLDKVKKQN